MSKNSNQQLVDVRADPWIALLMSDTATPAQISNWINANVTTIAQMQKALTTLALAVRYVYLRDL